MKRFGLETEICKISNMHWEYVWLSYVLPKFGTVIPYCL